GNLEPGVVFKMKQRSGDGVVETLVVEAVRCSGEGSCERKVAGLDGEVRRLRHKRIDEGVIGLGRHGESAATCKESGCKQSECSPSQHLDLPSVRRNGSPAISVWLSRVVKKLCASQLCLDSSSAQRSKSA